MFEQKESVRVEFLFLWVGVLIIVFGVSLFWVGFHNVDLGQNMRFLDAKLGVSLVDEDNFGVVSDGGSVYSVGLTQIVCALFVTGLGFFVFGVYFAFLIVMGGVHGKKK